MGSNSRAGERLLELVIRGSTDSRRNDHSFLHPHRRPCSPLQLLEIERNRVSKSASRLQLSETTSWRFSPHDLKNPMIGSERLLRFLLKGSLGMLTEEQTRTVLLLKQSNDDLLLMVKNLLELYRYDRDCQIMSFHDVEVQSIVSKATRELTNLAESHSVEIKALLGDDLPMVRADSTALTHVLTNLIQNAVKFSSEGTFVEVLQNQWETPSSLLRCETADSVSREKNKSISSLGSIKAQKERSTKQERVSVYFSVIR